MIRTVGFLFKSYTSNIITSSYNKETGRELIHKKTRIELLKKSQLIVKSELQSGHTFIALLDTMICRLVIKLNSRVFTPESGYNLILIVLTVLKLSLDSLQCTILVIIFNEQGY